MSDYSIKGSKFLSYILRHHPEEYNCSIDECGWVSIKDICDNTRFSMEDIMTIIKNDTRYELSSDYTKIRAYHGHSVEGVFAVNKEKPSGVLYHGTSLDALNGIAEDGYIKSMSRNYVHISESYDDALRVGSRHGEPVVIEIDVEMMSKEGFEFYKSGDGVWLTKVVPTRYIKNKCIFINKSFDW